MVAWNAVVLQLQYGSIRSPCISGWCRSACECHCPWILVVAVFHYWLPYVLMGAEIRARMSGSLRACCAVIGDCVFL